MNFTIGNPITKLLLASCLALTGLLIATWVMPFELAHPEAVGDDPANAGGVSAEPQSRYVHPDIANYSAILARPIFFPDRQLPRATVTATPVPVASLRLKLEGVAIVREKRVAVFRDQSSNRLVQLSVGMSYDDWQLESVTSASAMFRHGDQVTHIALSSEN